MRDQQNEPVIRPAVGIVSSTTDPMTGATTPHLWNDGAALWHVDQSGNSISMRGASASAWAIADPGNAGAISVANSGVCNLVSGGAETRTLAAPTFIGEWITLCCDTFVGSINVTVATAFDTTAHTHITFTAAGQYAELTACTVAGNRVWRLVMNGGATLA